MSAHIDATSPGARAALAVTAAAVAGATWFLVHRVYRQHQADAFMRHLEAMEKARSKSKSAVPPSLAAFAAETAKEDKVHLFTYPVLHRLSPSMTPFGTRVEVYMRMHDVPYEKHAVFKSAHSPTGLLPFVVFKGQVVTDSEAIIDFLDEAFSLGDSAGRAKGATDTALMTVVCRVTGHCLVPSLRRSFFSEDKKRTVFRYVVPSFFQVRENSPLAPVLRFVMATFFDQTMRSRFSRSGFSLVKKEAFEELFLRDLEGVEALLTASPFVAGEQFTRADAALYGVLMPVINVFRRERERMLASGRFAGAEDGSNDAAQDAVRDALFVNKALQYAYESAVLNAYVDRISQQAFPDLDAVLSEDAGDRATASSGRAGGK